MTTESTFLLLLQYILVSCLQCDQHWYLGGLVNLPSNFAERMGQLASVTAQSSANPNAQRSQLRDRRMAPGKLIAEGHNTKPVGRLKLLTYKLEEVDLLPAAELETRGAKEQISTAFRLTVTSEAVQGARVIWIDDVLLPEVWEAGLKSVATLIYDHSLIREGAVISVGVGSELYDLPERLSLPQSFKANQEPEKIEEGNKIVSIRSGLKIAGSARERVVVIEMRIASSLPIINNSYLVQIGRRFFGRVSGHGRIGCWN